MVASRLLKSWATPTASSPVARRRSARKLRRLAGALDGHAAAAANPRGQLVLVRERRAVRRHPARRPASRDVRWRTAAPGRAPDHQGDAQEGAHRRVARREADAARVARQVVQAQGLALPEEGPQDAPSVRGLRAQERLLLGGQPGGLERNQVAVLAQEPDGA